MFCTADVRLLCFSTSGRGHSTYFHATCSILHRPLPSSQRPITGLNGPWQPLPGKVWWITCSILHFPLPKRSPPRVHRKGCVPRSWCSSPVLHLHWRRSCHPCVYKGEGTAHPAGRVVELNVHFVLDYRIRWDYISISSQGLTLEATGLVSRQKFSNASPIRKVER